MRIETSLLHPVLRDYVDGLGVVARKDPTAEPKTAFQKWCRSIKVEPRKARHRPKTGIPFIPRAERRASIVGAIPGWRTVWAATGGYPDLVGAFADQVEARKKAAQA